MSSENSFVPKLSQSGTQFYANSEKSRWLRYADEKAKTVCGTWPWFGERVIQEQRHLELNKKPRNGPRLSRS